MNRIHTLIPRGVIVTCAPVAGGPFASPAMIAELARAAEEGGAVAVALRGAEVIRAAKRVITLPVLGVSEGTALVVREEVGELIRAGADVIQLDVSAGSGREPRGAAESVSRVRQEYNVPLLAAVSSPEDARGVIAEGAECIAPRPSVNAGPTKRIRTDVPDIELLERLVAEAPGQVIAEGRYQTPEQSTLALKLGAYAVILDAAVVDPPAIVRRFVSTSVPTS